jgi:type II secretory pathway pseudopilin PulG
MNKQHEAGFSLVEILVAFAILAGAITLSFEIFADGLRRLHEVEARTRTVDIARLELFRVTSASPLVEGVKIGATEGVAWRIVVAPAMKDFFNSSYDVRLHEVSIFASLKGEAAGDTPLLETLVMSGTPAQ